MARHNDNPPSIKSVDLRCVPVFTLSASADLPKYSHRRNVQMAAFERAGFTSITTVYGTHDSLNVVNACSLGHALLI